MDFLYIVSITNFNYLWVMAYQHHRRGGGDLERPSPPLLSVSLVLRWSKKRTSSNYLYTLTAQSLSFGLKHFSVNGWSLKFRLFPCFCDVASFSSYPSSPSFHHFKPAARGTAGVTAGVDVHINLSLGESPDSYKQGESSEL